MKVLRYLDRLHCVTNILSRDVRSSGLSFIDFFYVQLVSHCSSVSEPQRRPSWENVGPLPVRGSGGQCARLRIIPLSLGAGTAFYLVTDTQIDPNSRKNGRRKNPSGCDAVSRAHV